jgi:hypothetical protein
MLAAGRRSYTGRPMTSLDTSAATTLALKEWGAVAHALLDGRQTLLLRKGGIHEKAFSVEGGGGGFVLFPTVAHSHAERVRPEHADLLPLGAADVAEDALVVRCGIVVVDAVEVVRPEALPQVADLHIWTDASIREDRLEFRPRHPLHALVVRAVELPAPVRLPRLETYGGCRSWLDLPVAWDGRAGRVVHDEERLAGDAARVRSLLG